MLSSNHRACRKIPANGLKITLLKIQEQMWRAPACQQSMTPSKVAPPMDIKRIRPRDQTSSWINQIQSPPRQASLAIKESWSYPRTKLREFKKMEFPQSATPIVYKIRVFHRFELEGSFFLNIQAHALVCFRSVAWRSCRESNPPARWY